MLAWCFHGWCPDLRKQNGLGLQRWDLITISCWNSERPILSQMFVEAVCVHWCLILCTCGHGSDWNTWHYSVRYIRSYLQTVVSRYFPAERKQCPSSPGCPPASCSVCESSYSHDAVQSGLHSEKCDHIILCKTEEYWRTDFGRQ